MDESTGGLFSVRVVDAVLSGAAAGLIAAGLDAFQGRETLQTAFEVGLLFFHAAARSCFFGALMAVGACAAVFVSGRLLQRKSERASHRASARSGALGLTVLVAPGCAFTAWRLFQGGLTSRLPRHNALMVAAALILISLVFLGAYAALLFIERSDRKKRIFPIFVGVGFLLVAVAAHYVDGHFYRRLYLYLHGILGLLTLTGFGLFFRLSVLRLSARQRVTRLKWIISAILPLLFVVSLMTFGMRQTIKVAAFENTATLANLLQLFSFSVSSERRGNPSAKTVEMQRAREQAAKLASQGDFPVFPGAHILLISVDALRADRLGIYGHNERNLSSNIDAWAIAQGVIFDRAYCAAPHSSYSISSIHTGRYVHDEVMLKKEIAFLTMAEALRSAGYETYGFYTQGIFFTEGEKVAHYRRNKFGFEHIFTGAPRPDELTDRAIAEIDRAVLQGEPSLFIWAHYFNVHEPYLSTKLGTSPADRYDGEVLEADPEITRLIAHAEKVLKKEVIVVFTADHGEEFKDHGGYYHGSSLYDEQVRIPLVFHVPGAAPGRVMHPVTNIAVAPTLLRLVGVLLPPGMIETDLRPALFGGDEAHVETPVFAAVVNQHMVLSRPYKLIVDPSVDRFELYNLKTDPKEEFNLYDRNQSLADELRGEIDGFLDLLGKGESENKTTLNLGHMRDPRAVPGLVGLMFDPDAEEAERMEAADLLGDIRDFSTIPALKQLLKDKNDHVALAAAFSLGNLGDMSGEELLLDALSDDDPAIRDKAALVLGNRGELEAVPQLIEALGRDDDKLREQAVRKLGKLQDPAATEALLDLLDDLKIRYLTVLSLGMIGDKRAYPPLMQIIDKDEHMDVRGYAVVALGWMEAIEAIPRMLRVLAEEPEIKWTPETLVRFGAVGKAPLFGTDVAEGAPALRTGWGRCSTREKVVPSEFLNRTSCETDGPRADAAFVVESDDKTVLILRARHLLEGDVESVPLEIQINGDTVGHSSLTADFTEIRIPVKKDVFHIPPATNQIVLKLAKRGRFEVDHILVLAAGEIL